MRDIMRRVLIFGLFLEMGFILYCFVKDIHGLWVVPLAVVNLLLMIKVYK